MTRFFEIGIFPVVLTLTAFRLGQILQRKWKKPFLNPTLIGAVLVLGFLLLTGMELPTYQAGSAYLSWLMTPATIALAIPMYEQFQVLRKNLKAILIGVGAGALRCMGILLLGGRLLKLRDLLILSLLPKSVTTAIGVALSQMQGGLEGVTTAAIIITGIFANMMGTTLCRVFRITDEIAQGVALGTAGHVIGTARANELSPLTGAVSSLSLVVAGLMTAVFFPMLARLI